MELLLYHDYLFLSNINDFLKVVMKFEDEQHVSCPCSSITDGYISEINDIIRKDCHWALG